MNIATLDPDHQHHYLALPWQTRRECVCGEVYGERLARDLCHEHHGRHEPCTRCRTAAIAVLDALVS